MAATDLTAERVQELLAYDPETGVFTWRVARSAHAKPGVTAGCFDSERYRLIKIDGVAYKAHRLAWLVLHGTWPTGVIDHIDGNPSNNAAENLRDTSQTVNAQNLRRARRGNRSGVIGVHASPRGCKRPWQVQMRIGGNHVYLGLFDTVEDAYAAYVAAKRQHHEGCTL